MKCLIDNVISMISSCYYMCPRDFTSASVLAAIKRPPKNTIIEKKIVLTYFNKLCKLQMCIT